jgi:hypothetical protein
MELQERTQTHQHGPDMPEMAMPDTAPLHEQAADYLNAAERALRGMMSQDSQTFLDAILQHGAQ